jgi:hypothetical protein
MTRDEILDLCATFPGAVEDYPFGDGVAVFKVGGRMFALVPLDDGTGRVNLNAIRSSHTSSVRCTPRFVLATTRTSAIGTPSSWTARSRTTSFAKWSTTRTSSL